MLIPLLLGGCAIAQTATVKQAREAVLGMNVVDLMGCAGIFDRVMQTDDEEILIQYDAKTANSAPLTLNLPFGLVAAFGGSSGECHAHFRVLRDGTVAGVSFSGPVLADAAAICSGLVSECLEHPDQTPLPKGFDAMKQFIHEGGK